MREEKVITSLNCMNGFDLPHLLCSKEVIITSRKKMEMKRIYPDIIFSNLLSCREQWHEMG